MIIIYLKYSKKKIIVEYYKSLFILFTFFIH